jgi:cbb3-type cytochrome oxidase cytochrome c subunit
MRALLQASVLWLVACSGTEPPPITAAPKPPVQAPAAPAAPAGTAEVGPDGPADLAVPSVTPSTDAAVIAQGKAVYDAKGCGACHQFGSKLVGPDLAGLSQRRTPTWTARMIRYPDKMTKTDPVAKKLFATHMIQMTDQGVPDSDLGPLVSYLWSEGR